MAMIRLAEIGGGDIDEIRERMRRLPEINLAAHKRELALVA